MEYSGGDNILAHLRHSVGRHAGEDKRLAAIDDTRGYADGAGGVGGCGACASVDGEERRAGQWDRSVGCAYRCGRGLLCLGILSVSL